MLIYVECNSLACKARRTNCRTYRPMWQNYYVSEYINHKQRKLSNIRGPKHFCEHIRGEQRILNIYPPEILRQTPAPRATTRRSSTFHISKFSVLVFIIFYFIIYNFNCLRFYLLFFFYHCTFIFTITYQYVDMYAMLYELVLVRTINLL